MIISPLVNHRSWLVSEYLKLPEVARRLDVSEQTARRYIKSGALPSVFIGGAYRVGEEDLEAFVEAAKVTPGGDSPKAGSLLSAERALAIADPDDFRRVVKDTPTAELEQTALELAQLTNVPTREDLAGDKDDKEAHRRTMANYRISVINVELDSRGVRSPVRHVATRLDDALTPPEEPREEEHAG
jgi:excisionase family DNA binding protein